jgi:hypothetical protein
MDDPIQRLKASERRGSKPRCHLMTTGSRESVAHRLTALIEPFGEVSAQDRWMPQGFDNVQEAQLDKAPCLLDPKFGKQLRDWWLAAERPNSRTPNFDIASTCTVEAKPGVFLTEAKAHDMELMNEKVGKMLNEDASEDSRANHAKIADAIHSANDGLQVATAMKWQLSRDSHYQMSNRFAWSWKLTELGFSVILVYLGFLRAYEMNDKGKAFANAAAWEQLVREHSEALFPTEIWNQPWRCNGRLLVPLIKAVEQPLSPVAPK